MSRSYRKMKIFGNAKASDKKGKRIANRRFRRLIRSGLKQDKIIPTSIKEVSDTWAMPKDGKHWWNDATKKDMSK